LPDVLHVALSGVHVPLVHLPPQHSPSTLHAAVSGMHCFAEHAPLTQEKVQQSVLSPQAAPGAPQAPIDAAHVLLVISQCAVQQSVLAVQAPPIGLQSARGVTGLLLSSPPSAPPALSGELSLPQPTGTVTLAAAATVMAMAQASLLMRPSKHLAPAKPTFS
jgi:hypothetical protein